MKLRDNDLLVGLAVFYLAFWSIGPFVPAPFLSNFVSIFLAIVGGIAFANYAVPAYYVVFHKKRDETEQGSHLYVVGTCMIALGFISGALYNIWWTALGNPPNWIGSATANFSRITMGGGLFLCYIAPQATPEGIRLKGSMWVVAGFIIVFVTGLFFGAQMTNGAKDNVWGQFQFNQSFAVCPATQPVWGSSTRIYHTPASPYRAMLKPTRCFKDVAEAEAAGFVAAKWLN